MSYPPVDSVPPASGSHRHESSFLAQTLKFVTSAVTAKLLLEACSLSNDCRGGNLTCFRFPVSSVQKTSVHSSANEAEQATIRVSQYSLPNHEYLNIYSNSCHPFAI